MTDFSERLYSRNRSPLHLVLDEADAFAPQRTSADGARLLGAIEDLVRRGRARGIGVTLITQRPAVLHKDVLTQAEVLVAMRMTGPRDVAAIDEWVRLHAEDEQAAEVKASLPSLPVGTAWVWSPGWLNLLQRVQIRRARTFDSSATPRPGQARTEPKALAAVDLAQLGQRIAATVERAQFEDPAALRAQVAQLRGQLKERPVERVEVPVLDEKARVALSDALGELSAAQRRIEGLIAGVEGVLKPRGSSGPPTPTPTPASASAPTVRREIAEREGGRKQQREVEGLKKGALRMLQAMAVHHPARLSRAQLATLAGMKVTGGTFGTYLSALRQGGHLRERDRLLELTPVGLQTAGAEPVSAPATAEELRAQWRSALKAGARRMLDQLLAAYPEPMTRGRLANEVGMEASGGTFGTYLSTLRRNGLVDVDGDSLRAADVLFMEPPR